MKVILSGGGTGGHVNPALAIGAALEDYAASRGASPAPAQGEESAKAPPANSAEANRSSNFDESGQRQAEPVEISYIGSARGIERSLVPPRYPFYPIEIEGLRRELSLENLRAAALTVRAVAQTKKLLRRLRPDLVIGTGGYVCYPPLRAAADLHIPTALHESNAEPGLAAKMLAGKVDVVFVNFEKTKDLLPTARRVLFTGTPLRREFLSANKAAARRELDPEGRFSHIVVSFGGSLGARALNEAMLEVMDGYGRAHPGTLFLHATGDRYYRDFDAEFRARGLDEFPNLSPRAYFTDMAGAMAAADLAICRAGALTLSELSQLATPSILIPSPNVTSDQQTKNAALFAEAGAALLLPEESLTAERLEGQIEGLFARPERAARMSDAAASLAAPHAAERIARELFALAGKE